MKVEKCGTYHAKIEGCQLVKMPDGKSQFKVYFVSIIGRDNPSRTEWAHCGYSKESFVKDFQASGWEGVGFVTAFPHIIKVFRYSPKVEILQHVKAYDTKTGKPIGLDREDGFTEFACLAEALLANDEFIAWAKAQSVKEYMDFISKIDDAPVACNSKLKAYWEQDQ